MEMPAMEIRRGAMSRAEFRTVMEYLGYSREELADTFKVSERSVRYWLSGNHPVPVGVAEALDRLEDETREYVATLAASIKGGEERVVVFESDNELWINMPQFRGRPARWHRHAVMRAVMVAGAGEIEFWGDDMRPTLTV